MTVFFTSDAHFGHEHIIELSHRPFSSLNEMHEVIVRNWNNVVTKNDIVYFLGDFAFRMSSIDYMREIFNSLNGSKYLICGNHDKNNKVPNSLDWADIWDTHTIKVEGKHIFLSHYPHRSWPGSVHGSWHLYGHSHGSMENYGKSMDVGVDTHNFTPYSFNEVKRVMDAVDYCVNHHPELTSEELWEVPSINQYFG
jgi:calcineurin-like phosphoesterase family protein